MTRSMSHAARFAAGTTSGSAATQEFIFLSCNLGKSQGLMDAGGIGGGTRSRRAERIATGVSAVAGQVVIEPSPADLDFLLPWILGTNESSDAFTLAEALKLYGVDVAKGDDSYRYSSVAVSSAVFRSQSNGFLQLTMNLVGIGETAGITFPSITNSITTKRPYRHHEGTLTLGGTAQEFKSVELMIDNAVQADFYENAETISSIESGDRIVTLTADMPFDATTDELYEVAIAGLTTNTLVYTDGTDTLTFTLGNLKAATEALAIPPRPGEIRLGKTFQAYQSGSTKELAVTSTNGA